VPRTRPPRPSLPEAARLFRLLGESTRLSLLLFLAARGETPAGALAEAAGRSDPNVSKHLLRLRLGGVVTPRREGNWAYYRLNSPFVADLLREVCEG
jgi:ArsR family transcriptional regulator